MDLFIGTAKVLYLLIVTDKVFVKVFLGPQKAL